MSRVCIFIGNMNALLRQIQNVRTVCNLTGGCLFKNLNGDEQVFVVVVVVVVLNLK